MRYLAFISAGNHPAYCCNLSLPALPPSMQPLVQQLEHLAHLAHLAHPAQQLALAPLSSLFSPFSCLHGPIEQSGQRPLNSWEISVPSLITQSIIQSMQPQLQSPPPSCLRPLHAHHDVLPDAPLQSCIPRRCSPVCCARLLAGEIAPSTLHFRRWYWSDPV